MYEYKQDLAIQGTFIVENDLVSFFIVMVLRPATKRGHFEQLIFYRKKWLAAAVVVKMTVFV